MEFWSPRRPPATVHHRPAGRGAHAHHSSCTQSPVGAGAGGVDAAVMELGGPCVVRRVRRDQEWGGWLDGGLMPASLLQALGSGGVK